MREIRDDLDVLISFTKLWLALKLDHFKRLLDIHCSEIQTSFSCLSWYSDMLKKMTRYLCRIKQTWSYIVDDRETHRNKLDANIVHLLQRRCSFRSLNDRAYIEARLLREDILSTVRSSNLQRTLLQRILSIEHIIPSIHTFLEKIKWLESSAAILKNILLIKCKNSLAQAFRALHNKQTRLKEQTSAFSYRHRDLPIEIEIEWFSYRQLWLISLRHYSASKKDCARWKISNVLDKRKRDKESQEVETIEAAKPDFRQQWLRQLASLASTNEYQQIKHIEFADANTAKNFLLKMRSLKYYNLEGDRLRQKMQFICQVLKDIEEVKIQTRYFEMISNYDDCESDIEDRCERSQEHSITKDEENLFLNHIYSESFAIILRKYMTSFACKRDSFHFFFETSKHEAKSSQRSEEDLNESLDENVLEIDDTYRKTNLSAIDSDERNESFAMNNSLSDDKTQSDSLRSILSSITQENSLQLADAHCVSSVEVTSKTDENLSQIAKQREQEITISDVETSQLLLNEHTNADDQTFTILFSTKDSDFRARHANSHNRLSWSLLFDYFPAHILWWMQVTSDSNWQISKL